MTTRGSTNVIIPNGASISAAFDLGQSDLLFAIQMPASWTTADLTLQGSWDGSTFANIYDEYGLEVTLQAAASRFIILEPARVIGLRRGKIRSGTSGSAVNQGADRILQLITVNG